MKKSKVDANNVMKLVQHVATLLDLNDEQVILTLYEGFMQFVSFRAKMNGVVFSAPIFDNENDNEEGNKDVSLCFYCAIADFLSKPKSSK